MVRIRITFGDRARISYLPVNTNYCLVYLLDSLTKSYSNYLISLLPKNFKNRSQFDVFTFSQLLIPEKKIENLKMAVYSALFTWYVSSPFYQFLDIITHQLRKQKKVKIAGNEYEIESIEYLRSPAFKNKTSQFSCLSPISISNDKRTKLNGKNTLNKFLLPLHRDYIRRVTAPLLINAQPDILNLIYETGVEEYNRFEFGMTKKVKNSYIKNTKNLKINSSTRPHL